jgi:FMN phosphatase YigB (HAD superfamily)
MQALIESPEHAVAIATGGWRQSAELKLRSAGIDFANVPLITSNDHHERTAIMELALAEIGEGFESVSYYGDGPWDREACARLGWQFVAVGTKLEGLESYIGHAPIFRNVRAMCADDMDAIFTCARLLKRTTCPRTNCANSASRDRVWRTGSERAT